MSDPPMETPFECVDPSIGDQIWRLERPDLDPELRQSLLAHASVCHACSELHKLDAEGRELARSGSLENPEPVSQGRGFPVRRTHVAWPAGLALAASLAAVVLLPPRPITDGLSERGVQRVRFLRPVEGEILATTRPMLRWTSVAGASRYIVRIRDSAGKSIWEGVSPDPGIRIPEDASLVRGAMYKAILSTQPADLVDPGQVSVAFRSDSLGRMLLHRIRWTHPLLQWIGGLSFGLLLLLGIRRPRA